jgi:hypothetical protein
VLQAQRFSWCSLTPVFTPRNCNRKHAFYFCTCTGTKEQTLLLLLLLLLLGGITTGPLTVLESFLKSLVDSSHGDDVPEVVLMASKMPDDALIALLAQVSVSICTLVRVKQVN